MQLHTLLYTKKIGWADNFPPLNSKNTLLIVFASPTLQNEIKAVVHELYTAFPKSKMLDCSTAGEILGIIIYNYSLVVAITRFEHTNVKIYKTSLSHNGESFNAGESITNALKTADISGLFVLSDGLNVNGSELVAGCVRRRLLLSERTEEETEALIVSLPKNTIQIGFYSYGETSPYGVGSCDLHNQTMTMTTIYET